MGEDKPHRSASQVNTYLGCSEAYRLKYVDRPEEKQPPAAWLAQGTAFHRAMQLWEESGRSGLVEIDKIFETFYDEEIAKMTADEPDLNKWLKAPSKKTQVDIFERRERGKQQALEYIKFCEENPFVIKDLDPYTMGVEVPFQIELGGITVKGAIDLLLQHPEGVEVRDLKTGNRSSAKIQLGIYKVAVEKIFKWPVAAASFYYAKDSKVVTLTKDELARYTEEYVSEIFSALDKGIRNKVFIPNPGSQCTLCPVKKYCREMGMY